MNILQSKFWRVVIYIVIVLPILIAISITIFETIGRPLFKGKLKNFDFAATEESIDHRLPRNPYYSTNSDGIRSPFESSYFTEDQINIMIFGDSFTYGWKTTLDWSMPHHLQLLLREHYGRDDINVINCAWASASPLLQYRLMRDVAAEYRPDLVIQALDMTDFHDDMMFKHMFAKRGLYWFYDKTPCTLYLLFEYFPDFAYWLRNWSVGFTLPRSRYFAASAPLEETRHLLRFTFTNLMKMDSLSHEWGADFLMVTYPRAFQYSERECAESWENEQYEIRGRYALQPFYYIEEMRDSVDFPIISLLDDFNRTDRFPLFYADDPHWSPHGNVFAARRLFERFRTGGEYDLSKLLGIEPGTAADSTTTDP